IPIVIDAGVWKAYSAGLDSLWGMVSLMIVAMTILLSVIAIWNGYSVNRNDLEQQRTEGVLHRREMELRESERLARMGSWWWNPRINNVTWSSGLSHLAGRDPLLPPPDYKEHIGFYAPLSSAQFDAAIQDAIRTGAPYKLDLELIRA